MLASPETDKNRQGDPDYFSWKIQALRQGEQAAVARQDWQSATALAEERVLLQEIRGCLDRRLGQLQANRRRAG